MNKYLSLVIALFVLALAGCTLIPEYHRPTAAISPTWPEAPEQPQGPTNAIAAGLRSEAAARQAADIGWREFFRDPRLQQLIELALTNNLDLRVAMLNVDQMHSLYRVQRAELVPTVSVNAGGTRQRIAYGFAGNGGGTTFNQFNVNLGVAQYEVDLFGRVRSLKKQALETYFATEEARKSAQIALVAEVGAAYLTERELTEQLDVARQTLTAVQASYELTKRSYDAGVVSELDLRTAEGQMQTARSAVAGYEQQLAQLENYLVLLVGRPLPEDLPPPQPFNPQICLSDIPPGLPSDLLQRRPDILEAEHQLEAANANIGVARAAFFPTITLTGSAGTASTALEGLFAPGSQVWGISPQIQWPIFAAGTAWNELQAVKAGKRIEVANYQKAIQTAFREVADSLAVRATVEVQLDAGDARVKAEQRRYELAEARFRQGVDSYLTVLSAQQDLYNAQQSLIQSQYSRLFNLINLYQALGGGWLEHSPQPEPILSEEKPTP